MEDLILQMPKQLRTALEIADRFHFRNKTKKIKNVVLAGMGGSGIGGRLVKDWTDGKMKVPFEIVSDYNLPEYVNEDTLVIVSTYSGTTEETLECFEQAIQKLSEIIIITSGWGLIKRAKELFTDCIVIPDGKPPRAAIGYSIVQILNILHHYKLIDDYRKEIEDVIDTCFEKSAEISEVAKDMAEKLKDKTAIIYAPTGYGALATRFRQQLNENAKVLAWERVVPEMNHNEMVGIEGMKDDQVAVIFMPTHTENVSMVKRLSFMEKNIPRLLPVFIRSGAGYWQNVFTMIHYTDFVSLHLAKIRGVDPVEIPIIDSLKDTLKKV